MRPSLVYRPEFFQEESTRTSADESTRPKFPLSKLDGVNYWVLPQPAEIAKYVNIVLREEWERDALFEGRNPEEDAWLNSLPSRKWSLRTVDLHEIHPDPRIMELTIPATGYAFRKELKSRTSRLVSALRAEETVIPPLVIGNEDRTLKDGHCRYHALLKLRAKRVFVYSGRLIRKD